MKPSDPRIAAAERSVIGAVLLQNDAITRVNLDASDFFSPQLRIVYGAMLELASAHSPIDPQILSQSLNGTSDMWLDRELSECVTSVPTADNVEFYADAVREASLSRRTRSAISELINDWRIEGPDLIEQLARTVDLLRPKARPIVPPTAEAVLASDAFAVPQATYSTGFADLDALMDGGAKARQFTCLAGPPGAGKSALGMQVGRHLSEQLPVLYVSTELDAAEISARLAAPIMNVRPSEILSLQASPKRAAALVSELPFYVLAMDDIDVDVDGIRLITEAAHAVAAQAGRMPAIIVDYLQELAADDQDGKRMNTSRVAKQLRRMSRRLDTPVIGISSTARANYSSNRKAGVDGEEDPRAWLAAAKESGDIEYACAVFIFLEVDTKIGPTGESHARLIVAKSRRGRPGFVGAKFHGPSGRFYGNAESVSQMGAGKRAADLEQRIVEAVSSSATPMTRDRLVKITKAGRSAVWGAVKIALDDGRIVERAIKKPDVTGRMQTSKVLVIPKADDAC